MDDEHFDRFARRFADRLDAFRRGEGDEPSHDSGGALRRRDALRLIGAGAWAAASAVLARPLPASADVTASAGPRCRSDRQCGPKQKCLGKGNKARCTCVSNSPLYQDECGKDCTNFKIDDTNCGGCATTGDPPGTVCIPGRTTCVEGECVAGDYAWDSCREREGGPGCPAESVCCGEPTEQEDVRLLVCRNLKHDKNHCGSCNHACTEGKQPACCYGRCRDLHADPLNCGKCLNRCPKNKPICFGGKCREQCPRGTRQCGRTCGHPPTERCCNKKTVVPKEDLQHDAKNCGDCGRDCSTFATAPDPPVCCGGECCDYNFPACCSGQCTNLRGLEPGNTHCGACGNTCKPNEKCQLGRCVCPPGGDC